MPKTDQTSSSFELFYIRDDNIETRHESRSRNEVCLYQLLGLLGGVWNHVVWHDEELPSNCASKYKIQKINIQNKKATLTSRVLTERAWVDWLVLLAKGGTAEWYGGLSLTLCWRTTTTTVLLWQPGLFIFYSYWGQHSNTQACAL